MKRLIYIFFLILFFSSSAFGATIHGKVFEWFTLDSLNDAVIDINSVPFQRIVSVNGVYSFQVPLGTYEIKATYFSGGRVEYFSKELIKISSDGNYNLDLILFPPIEDSALNQPTLDSNFEASSLINGSNNIPEKNDLNLITKTDSVKQNFDINIFLISGLALLLIFLVLFFIRNKKKSEAKQNISLNKSSIKENSKNENFEKNTIKEELRKIKLDSEAKKVLDIIKQNEGRITQLNLRKKIDYFGEAKISLILAELEEYGFIKKIKKGRGNILIYQKEG